MDDAIGEAFDKIGRRMGLTYPCGAAMDRLAASGDPSAFKLPPAHIRDGSFNFSLSGLKTYTVNLLNTESMKGETVDLNDLCASLTKSICDSVVHQLSRCANEYKTDTLLAAGGVLANTHLRAALQKMCAEKGIDLHMPPISLCGDNDRGCRKIRIRGGKNVGSRTRRSAVFEGRLEAHLSKILSRGFRQKNNFR